MEGKTVVLGVEITEGKLTKEQVANLLRSFGEHPDG
jgi:hypothetical protein